MRVEGSQMSYRDDLIRQAIEAQGFTNETLAKAAGLAVATVSSIRNGKENITLTSLRSVAHALSLDWSLMFTTKPAEVFTPKPELETATA